MSRSSMESAPSSDFIAAGNPSPPSTAMSSPDIDAVAAASSSHLDDIFGSSPSDHAEPILASTSAPSTVRRQEEPSDLPSLRRQHVTAGYRDGVSAAKTSHVQEGFDKGFPVGAELGVRVGIVLGVLEGLVTALAAGGDPPASERMRGLYEAAKKDLAVQNVFGAVAAQSSDGEDESRDKSRDEDTCARFAKLGDGVVATWEDRVNQLLAEVR